MKNLKEGGEKRQLMSHFFIVTVQYLQSTLNAGDDKNSVGLLVPNNNSKKQTKNKTQNPSLLLFNS